MKPRPFREDEWFSPGPGGRYPAAMPGMINGCYAIRDAKTQAVLYVGESHSNRLRKAMINHMSPWYDQGHPREFYDRRDVQLAWYAVPGDRAAVLECEGWLIRHYCPRDNTKGLWEECSTHPHAGYGREEADWVESAAVEWPGAPVDDAVPF